MIHESSFNKRKRYQNEALHAAYQGLLIPGVNVAWGVHGMLRHNKEPGIFISMDSPIIGPRNPDDIHHVRVGLNHHLQGLGYYNNRQKPSDRWEEFAHMWWIWVEPWKSNLDSPIYVICDRSGLYESLGDNIETWLNDVLTKIRDITDHKIIVRFKNTDRDPPTYIPQMYENVEVSKPKDMADYTDTVFADMRVAVVYTSNFAVNAAINGIPIVVTNKNAWAAPIGYQFVGNVMCPAIRDRTEWLNSLAYSTWSFSEIADGTVARHLGFR